MAIRILTDSSAEFSQEELKQTNIWCVPITVIFGERAFLDGEELSKEVFYNRLLEQKDFPKTSQPSPEQFLRYFEEAKAAGDSVIAILLSSALSGTVQSAYLAREMCDYDKIYIVDSFSATGGIRILVEEAIRLRDQGNSAQAIVKTIESLRHRICIFAGLDTLEYLYKGGRLSRAQAIAGSLAKVKPIITVTQEGLVAVCGKAIGRKKAVSFLVQKTAEHPIDFEYPVYYVYSYDAQNCRLLQKKTESESIWPNLSANQILNIGPTIGTHIGTGAFGIIYIKKE